MNYKNNQQNNSSSLIHIIGTDASGPEKLPLFLQEIILTTKKLAAPKRILKITEKWLINTNKKKPLPELFESDKPEKLILWLREQKNQTVVLASGDPLWFGIGRCLTESLPSNRLVFHPCASSLQLAFARLGRPWQDASWLSLHGRDSEPLGSCLQKRPKALAILTDPSRNGAKEVREYLRAAGLEDSYAFWIFERLGHSQERIEHLTPKDELPNDLDRLHLVILISQKASAPDPKKLPLFGLEDGIYLQYSDRPGLMTKREVRIQLIADLELPERGVIWDIGAGVGSVGLEALRLSPKLHLLAIDKRIGASALIRANAKRLSVKPSAIIEADALESLKNINFPKDLVNPDRVILGGCGSSREKLLEIIIKKINPNGIIVIPLVTLEATSRLIEILKTSNFKLSITQHQTSRGVPLSQGTRLMPMNPVFILKGRM